MIWSKSETNRRNILDVSLLDEACGSYAAAARYLKREISTRHNIAAA
jgi:hypothetical protein